MLVHQYFEQQVERTPDILAVSHGEENLRYHELNCRANQLARFLQRLGVSSGSRVGLLLPRCLDVIIGLLGTLKAGGCFVPLDPTYPRQRLQYLLADARPAYILTHCESLAHVPAGESQVIPLDSEWQHINTEEQENVPASRSDLELPAYVIYTSGTSGNPKGVVVPHRALVNHNLSIADIYALQPGDRVLQFASPSFDVSIEEIVASLVSGASVIIPDYSPITSTDLAWLVKEQRLTVLNLPSPFWSDWVQVLARTQASLPASLRLVVVGSEKVTRESFTLWKELAGERVRCLVAYGTSETTITSTIFDPELHPLQETGSFVPIGLPIANTSAYVLDSQLNAVSLGMPGELYLGGKGIASGYLNQPELTRERFLSDPCSPDPRTRLYKTGDLVRFLPNGSLEFLGRTDRQLKLRGVRIEPAEIEEVLLEHPSVREALVDVREDGPGAGRLVAYLLPSPGYEQELSSRALRTSLRTRLPHYMVPTDYVTVEHWPLSSNGKVDKDALSALGTSQPVAEEQMILANPLAPVAERLTLIWQEVLRLEQIGPDENFFEIGGHSLLATQIMARIHTTFGLDLPLHELFAAPTIAALALLIEQTESRGLAQQAGTPIPRATREAHRVKRPVPRKEHLQDSNVDQ